MKFWQKIESAFKDDKTEGFSARKLSAFVMMVIIVIDNAIWLKHSFITDDFNLLPEILIIDCSFVLALYGLINWKDIRFKKYGKSDGDKQED